MENKDSEVKTIVKSRPGKKGETKYSFAPRTDAEWKTLKLSFMASPCESLTEYIIELYGKPEGEQWVKNGNFQRHTKWWLDEKKAYLDRIEKEALDKARKKAVAELTIDIEDLLKTKKATIELAKIAVAYYQKASMKRDKKTGKMEVVSAPSMKDVERIHKMVRTELGENTEKIDHTTGGQPLQPFGGINVIISDNVKKEE